jgi:uncharacterized protein with FMN-binding domain
MRRMLLITAGLLLVFAGVAFAASYKTGTYTAGSSTGTGVDMRVKKGSFSVNRVSFKETCSNSSDSFDEPFAFVRGTEAKLTGKVKSDGRFSGSYHSSAGSVKVSGRVTGGKATVKATESGSYTPQGSTASYKCSGSHTFHAKRH